MIHLDYRDARPIYTQIADGFREKIATGVLLAGEKLPSVRELASELTINPNTIQRSYRQLEAEGWIATVPGKGCFVCGSDQCQQQEKDRLYSIFDETSSALFSLGETPEILCARILKGGKKNA